MQGILTASAKDLRQNNPLLGPKTEKATAGTDLNLLLEACTSAAPSKAVEVNSTKKVKLEPEKMVGIDSGSLSNGGGKSVYFISLNIHVNRYFLFVWI